jgi:chorismate synthase
MNANSFGNLFRITSFGESHGTLIGVVIDGCPSNIEISENEIYEALKKRRPGSTFTSPRKEEDIPKIVSGVFEGKTTGHPVCILIENKNADSAPYDSAKTVLKPSHAHATYLGKYGIYDHQGSSRASGRETALRVAASVLAKKVIEGVQITSYIKQIGNITADTNSFDHLLQSKLFCPDPIAEKQMQALILKLRSEGDSIGALIETRVESTPLGLGDPVFERLEANLAKAMLSIPGTKGFEIGSGFSCVEMHGSEHNDPILSFDRVLQTKTNHAGGVLGGISTGGPLIFRVAAKPTSSIQKPQITRTVTNKEAIFELPPGSKHDPCIGIRMVPVVEAMTALVLADSYLLASKYTKSNQDEGCIPAK